MNLSEDSKVMFAMRWAERGHDWVWLLCTAYLYYTGKWTNKKEADRQEKAVRGQKVTQQNDAWVEQSREIRILQEKIDKDMHLYSKYVCVREREREWERRFG